MKVTVLKNYLLLKKKDPIIGAIAKNSNKISSKLSKSPTYCKISDLNTRKTTNMTIPSNLTIPSSKEATAYATNPRHMAKRSTNTTETEEISKNIKL